MGAVVGVLSGLSATATAGAARQGSTQTVPQVVAPLGLTRVQLERVAGNLPFDDPVVPQLRPLLSAPNLQSASGSAPSAFRYWPTSAGSHHALAGTVSVWAFGSRQVQLPALRRVLQASRGGIECAEVISADPWGAPRRGIQGRDSGGVGIAAPFGFDATRARTTSLEFVATETGAAGDGSVDGAREKTPGTDPDRFRPVRGRSGKVDSETGEVWEKDKLRKDHYEVYKNQKDYEKGVRVRDVWADGRPKGTK